MKEDGLERNAAEALRTVLDQIAFVEVAEVRRPDGTSDWRVDWQARLRLPDKEWLLLVEVKNSGEPRLARAAVNQLLRALSGSPNAYGVFVAPWISTEAAAVCREAGIGYLDLAGNCFLAFGTVHIERTGQPNPSAEKRGLRSLYSAKAERVLRVLLQAPGRRWKLEPLAAEAQVSLGQVHKVKSLLADREWVRSDPEGLVLTKPAELLSDWSRNYRHRRNEIHQYYTLAPLREAERSALEACAQVGARSALAGFSAAERLAPFVRYQRGSLYVEREALPKVVSELGLKEVTSGANLALWIPYDDGVWYGLREVDGATITSPVQTYLDLLGLHGRGEEAAAFLLQQEIRPQW